MFISYLPNQVKVYVYKTQNLPAYMTLPGKLLVRQGSWKHKEILPDLVR